MKEFSSNSVRKGILTDLNGELATDCDWLLATWQTLYQNDHRGRITRSHARRWGRVPIFQLGRTRHGNLWRVEQGVPGPVATRLGRLAAREAALGDSGPPWPPCERQGSIRAVIGSEMVRHGEQDCEAVGFRLPEPKRNGVGTPSTTDVNAPTRPRLEAPTDPLAQNADVGPESVGHTVSMEGGEVASICEPLVGAASSFIIAYVETEVRWRRRGHASKALEGWLVRVREAGGTPIFMAESTRPEAQALAASVGLEAFAALSFWF